MKTIDLHIHTVASDGTDTPSQAVKKAAELGLAAIGITDHDSVAGVKEAQEAGAALGLEVVSGIEVSSDYRDNNVHVLGYFVDPDATALCTVMDWISREREERNVKMAAMLAADGFDISMEELRQTYPGAVLGRPHFAELMMKKGYVSSVTEGFDRYLEVGRRYFLPKRRIPFAEAISLILSSGGVPVLAHPFQYHYSWEETMELVDTAEALGIRHLEAYYSEHTPEQQAQLLALAAERGFGVTGGSDYHGSRKPYIRMGSGMGNLSVPYSVLESLRRDAGRV